MHSLTRSLAVLGSLTICLAVASLAAQVSVPDDLELQRDVEFGKGGGRPLKMHILRLKTPSAEPMPVLVWVHGGGWETGSKEGGLSRLIRFAQRGYFCVAIEYRFSGEAIFPAQIEDCKCAIRCLRAKAKQYNIDPVRIGAWGYSAGGHLVALLGTSAKVKQLEGKGGWPQFSSQVQAVSSFAGPGDFPSWGDQAPPQVAKLLGGLVSANRAKAALASPVAHIGSGLPPFLIVHGEKDTTVPLSQAETLYAAIKKAGADATLHVIPGGSHNLLNADTDKLAEAFFDQHLKTTKPRSPLGR